MGEGVPVLKRLRATVLRKNGWLLLQKVINEVPKLASSCATANPCTHTSSLAGLEPPRSYGVFPLQLVGKFHTVQNVYDKEHAGRRDCESFHFFNYFLIPIRNKRGIKRLPSS